MLSSTGWRTGGQSPPERGKEKKKGNEKEINEITKNTLNKQQKDIKLIINVYRSLVCAREYLSTLLMVSDLITGQPYNEGIGS